MRTFEEIFGDAADRPPFSNMTSFEVFAANVCGHGAGCVHDGVWGGGPSGADCPIITASLTQKTPKEWTEHTPQEQIQLQAYDCDGYEEFVATATDDEPSQLDEDPDERWAHEESGWRRIETLPMQEGLF